MPGEFALRAASLRAGSSNLPRRAIFPFVCVVNRTAYDPLRLNNETGGP